MPLAKPITPFFHRDSRLLNGLVESFPFFETSGLATLEYVSNLRLPITNPPVNWSGGQLGQAPRFNGVNQSVFFNPSYVLGFSSSISVVFWVNTPGGTQGAGFGNATGQSIATGCHLPWNDNVAYFDYFNTGTQNRISIPFTPYLNQWTHVVWICDGHSYKAIYINGNLVASDGSNINYLGATTNNIDTVAQYGGGGGAGSPYYFNGRMAQFLMYNRLLSASEVRELYVDGFVMFRKPNIRSWRNPLSAPKYWTLVAHGAVNAQTAPSLTLDTTGANLIVVQSTSYQHVNTISDNRGNTWVDAYGADAGTGDAQVACVFWYCLNPVGTGPGHIITGTNATVQCGIAVEVWGTGGTTVSLDQSSYGANSGNYTSGSITPTHNGELIVTGCSPSNPMNATSVSTGFTITDNVPNGPNGLCSAIAYQTQTTAAPISATWTTSGGPGAVVGIHAFYAPGLSGGIGVITGTLSATDPHDTTNIHGLEYVSGPLNTTDTPDHASFVGSAFFPGITGTLRATD